tara:strand:- start:160 stop:1011 length:852 start_codon:yes stop_codon:yes gene_type:complete
MTDEERRRLEERRKREMMSEAFQRHIQATLQARAAGKPDPAPLDESGQLIRPYADPRDATIASSPALVRPVHSILDRMLRPGRAGMADRMNREYLEGVLKRDADQRMGAAKLKQQQATATIAEVQRKAAEGDPVAIGQLKAYSEAMNAGRGTGSKGDDYATQLIKQFGGGTNEVRDPETGETIIVNPRPVDTANLPDWLNKRLNDLAESRKPKTPNQTRSLFLMSQIAEARDKIAKAESGAEPLTEPALDALKRRESFLTNSLNEFQQGSSAESGPTFAPVAQ